MMVMAVTAVTVMAHGAVLVRGVSAALPIRIRQRAGMHISAIALSKGKGGAKDRQTDRHGQQGIAKQLVHSLSPLDGLH